MRHRATFQSTGQEGEEQTATGKTGGERDWTDKTGRKRLDCLYPGYVHLAVNLPNGFSDKG